MKVTVIGAGAIGTLLAYKLSKAGEEITIIAKSEQISEIDNKLIYAGPSKVEEIPIITKTEIEKTDYIIIASKSYDVDKIIDSVKDKEVPIMFCQNGLKILDLIERELKDKTISYMVTGNGVSKSGPARIKHNGVGFTYIGNIGQETDYLTKKIVSMLKSVNFNAEIASVAKKDLKAGQKLDGEGGYCARGRLISSKRSKQERILPMGYTDNAVLKNDIMKDQFIRLDDVELNLQKEIIEAREYQYNLI